MCCVGRLQNQFPSRDNKVTLPHILYFVDRAEIILVCKCSLGNKVTIRKAHCVLAGFPLLPALTCFFNVGAFLVHGGAQCRRPDVQQPHLLHTTVEHSQRVLFVLVVVV